jgi:hypothetical protein
MSSNGGARPAWDRATRRCGAQRMPSGSRWGGCSATDKLACAVAVANERAQARPLLRRDTWLALPRSGETLQVLFKVAPVILSVRPARDRPAMFFDQERKIVRSTI